MNILIKIAIGFFIIGFLITPAISAEKEFAGINFGVGISLTYDLGSNDRVESASLDEKRGSSLPLTLLEMSKSQEQT